MVKITNTPEEINPKKQNKEEQKLTPEKFQEMLKPKHKTDTTPINFRLDTNIVNEMKNYANERNKTLTDVFKNVLTEYFNNKKITKGTFNLNEPVNLIIPKSDTLLYEYRENSIDIISTIKETNTGMEIHPLDPQIKLYESGNYEIITVNQANNILDAYDFKNNCYRCKLDDGFLGDDLINPDTNIYSYHSGLLLLDVKNYANEITTVIIATLVFGNELIGAHIIDRNRAIELARKTKDNDLIKYILNIDVYNDISNLVSYDMSNKELSIQNYEMQEVISNLLAEKEELRLKVEKLENESKNNIKTEDTELLQQVEDLTEENKKLKSDLKKLETKYNETKDTINKIINVMEL